MKSKTDLKVAPSILKCFIFSTKFWSLTLSNGLILIVFLEKDSQPHYAIIEFLSILPVKLTTNERHTKYNKTITSRVALSISVEDKIQKLRMAQHHFIHSFQGHQITREALVTTLLLVQCFDNESQSSKNLSAFKFVPENTQKNKLIKLKVMVTKNVFQESWAAGKKSLSYSIEWSRVNSLIIVQRRRNNDLQLMGHC